MNLGDSGPILRREGEVVKERLCGGIGAHGLARSRELNEPRDMEGGMAMVSRGNGLDSLEDIDVGLELQHQ